MGILILCLASAAAALDFKYHHTEELEEFLRGVHAAYPSLTHLHSIGRSVEGKRAGTRGEILFVLTNSGQVWVKVAFRGCSLAAGLL